VPDVLLEMQLPFAYAGSVVDKKASPERGVRSMNAHRDNSDIQCCTYATAYALGDCLTM